MSDAVAKTQDWRDEVLSLLHEAQEGVAWISPHGRSIVCIAKAIALIESCTDPERYSAMIATPPKAKERS